MYNCTFPVPVQSFAVDMAFSKNSFLRALSVLLWAWVLVQCQPPLKPVEEETNITSVVMKFEPVPCPLDCSCTAEGSVDCAGVDLTEFPAELSDKTRQLSLQVCLTERHTYHTSVFFDLSSSFRSLQVHILSVFCSLILEQQN